MKLSHPFANQVNFLDPLKTSDGKPYGPWKFKELVKECYIISKVLNTSYKDALNITYLERVHLLNLIIEENERQKKELDKIKQEREFKKNHSY